MALWLGKLTAYITYSADMTKVELYDLIVTYKLQYGTSGNDNLFAEHGHTVIRLPLYHPS